MTTQYAINRGQRIAYEVHGAGRTPVVLQHAFLRNRHSWKTFGYVDALASRFMVITVDSLGHGDSDKPPERALYTRKARVDDVTAVLDDLNIARAHYVGYSMGSWLGLGLLAWRPERLLSATLGGFDPAPGAMLPPAITIDVFLDMARAVAPDAVAWVTPEIKPALAACLDALRVHDVPADVVMTSKVPLHFWTGSEDSCFAALKALHAKVPGAALTVVPGDHAGAMARSRRESAEGISKFLTRRSPSP
jgi:pimeloyl-ACP methyl ester carboxylesterase